MKKLIVLNRKTRLNHSLRAESVEDVDMNFLSEKLGVNIESIDYRNQTFRTGNYEYSWYFILDREIEVGDTVVRVASDHFGWDIGDIMKVTKINGTCSMKIEDTKNDNDRDISYDMLNHAVIDTEARSGRSVVRFSLVEEEEEITVRMKRKKIRLYE